MRRDHTRREFLQTAAFAAAALATRASGAAFADAPKRTPVIDTHLHFEAFGPLSVKRVGHVTATPATPAAARPLVTFRKTGTAVPWDGSHETLLDLAEHLGIAIASGCRAGNCGTCVLAMQSGEVAYIQPPGSPPEARTCLTCIAQPKGNVVLDA